jgi:hypothetical protein
LADPEAILDANAFLGVVVGVLETKLNWAVPADSGDLASASAYRAEQSKEAFQARLVMAARQEEEPRRLAYLACLGGDAGMVAGTGSFLHECRGQDGNAGGMKQGSRWSRLVVFFNSHCSVLL